MRLLNVRGKAVNKNVSKYLIDWNGSSRSNIQKATKQFLKKYWRGHIVYEEFPVYGTRMKVDILNATCKIAVEVNGKQHGEFTPFFHNNPTDDFLKSIKRDVEKAEWLERNDYTLVEIEYDEVAKLTKDYVEKTYGIRL